MAKMQPRTCATCLHGAFEDKNAAETLDARMKMPDNGECRYNTRTIFMAVLPGPQGPAPQFFHIWPAVQRQHWCRLWEKNPNITQH